MSPKPSIGVNIDRGISDGGMTRIISYPALTMTPLKCKKHGTISPSGMHFFLFFSFLSRSEHFCEFIEPYNNSLMPRVPYWWSQSPSNWKPYQSPRGRCASISFGWDFFWPASTVLTMMVDVWDFEASLVLFVVLFLCVLLLVLWLVSLLVCWFCSCSCSCCCCCCFCCWLLLLVVGCWLLIADCWLLLYCALHTMRCTFTTVVACVASCC